MRTHESEASSAWPSLFLAAGATVVGAGRQAVGQRAANPSCSPS